MPRKSRLVIPMIPHHITHRGVRGMDLFFSNEDRILYLSLIAEAIENAGFEVLNYCLMTNHVHLIVIPHHETSLAKGIGIAHRRYSRMINKRLKTSGHLFQERFFSCAMDQPHLSVAARYVERNPIRAGLCSAAEEYHWSSARFHMGLVQQDPIASSGEWFGSPKDWKLYLQEHTSEIEIIRRHFKTGMPLGNYDFIKRLENETGQSWNIKPQGRPRII
ncbi:MAG: transposase [SAR324 cluster bacterium]|nr:transposase [SAR324 cluster bacterium]MBL7035533.1 transposase [SAR324 cluster bacterium]